MPVKLNWVTFFSQTGSEIYKISKKVNRVPDVIVTNKPKDQILDINQDLYFEYGDRIVFLPKKPSIEEYRQVIPKDALVTLHGWLRIIPPEICEEYEIYNGHPAPIHLYPSLKGLDKQEDLYKYKEKYNKIGCVIHRVTPVLDDGEIIISIDQINDIESAEDAYKKVIPLSLQSWIQFFNDYLPNKMHIR
jgi:folate-dependent phosphoribosylglycinamide formyltransferase PurN